MTLMKRECSTMMANFFQNFLFRLCVPDPMIDQARATDQGRGRMGWRSVAVGGHQFRLLDGSMEHGTMMADGLILGQRPPGPIQGHDVTP